MACGNPGADWFGGPLTLKAAGDKLTGTMEGGRGGPQQMTFKRAQ